MLRIDRPTRLTYSPRLWLRFDRGATHGDLVMFVNEADQSAAAEAMRELGRAIFEHHGISILEDATILPRTQLVTT